jgi:hypothetical protein
MLEVPYVCGELRPCTMCAVHGRLEKTWCAHHVLCQRWSSMLSCAAVDGADIADVRGGHGAAQPSSRHAGARHAAADDLGPVAGCAAGAAAGKGDLPDLRGAAAPLDFCRPRPRGAETQNPWDRQQSRFPRRSSGPPFRCAVGLSCITNQHQQSCSYTQDPSGQLQLRLLFMDRPPHTALSLQPGHSIAVADVAVPEQQTPAVNLLQAEWTEVCSTLTELSVLVAMCNTVYSHQLSIQPAVKCLASAVDILVYYYSSQQGTS